jgi:hypothetical protein
MRYIVLLLLLFWVTRVTYAQSFYVPNVIQKIEIQFPSANWDYQMDTSKYGKEGYTFASYVKINGTKLDSVGVKYKGNSSYDSTRKKNPLHIELDNYNKGRNYQGFTDIKLSNCYQDPSMVREVMAYQILGKYMDVPMANFAQVYINGVYYGVYTNVESINKSFCANHFFGDDGTFIKGNPNLTPSISTKCNLLKLSGDSSAYFPFYEIKSDYGWRELERLADSVTNSPNSLARVMDIDRAIWMLAFNAVLINLDSYSGAFCQNYYMYKDGTNRFNLIVWDMNMAFGGFPFVGSGNSSFGSLTIPNMQNLPMNIHGTDNFWPLIKAIQANPTYKRMYIAHARTILNNNFSNGQYIADYNTFKNLIDTAVQSDNKKFFTYTQFQNALTTNYSVGSYSVPGIQTLMNARNTFLQGTTDFTAATPTIAGTAATTTNISLNNTITFTAQIINATSVTFAHRYKRSEVFKKLIMYDDGQHSDGAAGDNIYGTSFLLENHQLQYYVYAENANAGIFAPEEAEHVFYNLNIYPTPTIGQVVINELLADNNSDVRNEYHQYEDWIELYNTTNSTLSLSNLYLTNSAKTRAKFVFPNGSTIEPYSFITVWADEINLPNATQIHANFKLDKDADDVILSDGLATTFDKVSFSNQEEDESYGRCPDGVGAFKTFEFPSFGLSNCSVGVNESKAAISNAIKVYPNPANDVVNIQTEKKEIVVLKDVLGKTVKTLTVDGFYTLSLTGINSGIYFVSSKNSTQKLIISHE